MVHYDNWVGVLCVFCGFQYNTFFAKTSTFYSGVGRCQKVCVCVGGGGGGGGTHIRNVCTFGKESI